MKVCDACCLKSNDSNVVCSENKKRFCVKNPKSKDVWKCRVDGCWIKGRSAKCDYLVKVGDEVLFLVELKGVDHIRALEQLVSTAEVLKVASFKGDRKTVIVGSPCPKASTKYQKEQKRLAPRFRKAGIPFPVRKNGNIEVSA